MRRWFPQPSVGRWIGLALLALALAGALALALRLGFALAQPPERWPVNLALYGQLLALVGLLLLAGVLAYRVAGAFTLAYELDRNGLYIHWMGNRAVVPLAQIESVDVGAPGARLPWRPFQGIGYYWGRGQTATGRRLHLFATQRLERCLVLHTAGDSYAISPLGQDSFVQDLEQRRNLGAIKPLAPTLEPGRIFFYEFWNDALVRWALLLAFGLNLLLLGLIAARYPQLGANVELRYNAAGELAELRPRHQVLFLPLAAFMLSLVNTGLGLSLYMRERTGARLLQAASVLLQLLFGIAALTVII
jgi:hypothetical protein